MKLYFTLLVVLLLAIAIAAQEPVITPDTQADSATLSGWLHSGNPRLVAWAADFARRKHDAAVIAELPAWLEHAAIPGAYGGDASEQAQRRAVLAVLDTLIQENVHAPTSVIARVSPAFEAQAAILLSRYPLVESRNELDGWFAWGTPSQIRIAAMLFAKDPASLLTTIHSGLTFVGGIVADSESELHIIVVPDGTGRGGGWGSAACGDSGGQRLPDGWPQVYTYTLAENDSNANGPVVVEIGGDRIATWRHSENGGWGSCYGVQPLNSYTRHRLIAYWLGVKPEEMAWQPRQTFTIKWAGQTQYERELGKIVDGQRQKLRATSEALRARGVLEGPDAVPKLVVVVECEMEPCPLN